MNKQAASLTFVFFFLTLILPVHVLANNLDITNVRLGTREPSSKSLSVLFDVSWENSWRNKINHDAVWMTVRLHDSRASLVEKRLCQMKAVGINPSGVSTGSSSLEVEVPSDKTGAYLRKAANDAVGPVAVQNVMLTVNYESCGFSDSDQVTASVLGVEMVFVPEGAFFAGDRGASTAAFRQGSVDSDAWAISSESAIPVTGAVSDGYYYTSAGGTDEYPTGTGFSVPAAFPKGHSPFYVMKYEITEGEWVAFINGIPASARSAHDLTDTTHKNSDSVIDRNTIACSGNPLVCTTQRPSRPVSYLGWKDLAAFLDWMALRPMTELEFEKAARGPFVPVKGAYAWGTTTISPASAISVGEEDGEEVVEDPGANANYGAAVFTGGDSVEGPEYSSGPLRGAIFSTDISDREVSGAGNYGSFEMSGNLKEWVVSVGSSDGLVFSGANGDGYLTTLSGFAGQANVSGWPGMDTDEARGITGVKGVGFRGGAWDDPSDRLRVSDRAEAVSPIPSAASSFGGRGVRTATK
ncbi:MAG: formylglycine-generating enzyme family protein [Elusimicrobia bacterium]|nr:formylglycine-generating enzyme family protein [Elusimicrobiota bacterium]